MRCAPSGSMAMFSISGLRRLMIVSGVKIFVTCPRSVPAARIRILAQRVDTVEDPGHPKSRGRCGDKRVKGGALRPYDVVAGGHSDISAGRSLLIMFPPNSSAMNCITTGMV